MIQCPIFNRFFHHNPPPFYVSLATVRVLFHEIHNSHSLLNTTGPEPRIQGLHFQAVSVFVVDVIHWVQHEPVPSVTVGVVGVCRGSAGFRRRVVTLIISGFLLATTEHILHPLLKNLKCYGISNHCKCCALFSISNKFK